MEGIDDRLFDWGYAGPLVLFCAGLFVITFVLRKAVELALPTVQNSRKWREGILPVAPVYVGAVLAFFAKSYPFPAPIAPSKMGRILLGMVLGYFSRWLYKIGKAYVKRKYGVEVSEPPSATQEALKSIPVPRDVPPANDGRE